MEELNYLRRQTRSLEGLIQQLTEELPKFAAAENQSATLSPESALEQCVRFFDHAIEKDQQLKAGGTRWTVFFRIHRAQCLAFLNKHEAAFAEVDALAERPRQIQSGWVPAVFRIFAIVITVADQPEVRLQAVERAGSFLQVMKDDDYFDNRQNLNRLREESSLQPLITRPEIEAFLEELDTE